jgi:hemoglobin-like flavoprotein
MRDWLYHLFNDPIRSNPWSMVTLILIVVGGLAGMVMLGRVLAEVGKFIMFRRRVAGEQAVQPEQPISAPPAQSDADRTQNVGRYLPDTADDRPQTGDGYAGAGRIEGERATDTSVDDPVDVPLDDTLTRMRASEIQALRPPCPACRGKGYVMTTSDLLRESIALLDGETGDTAILTFYSRLLDAAPNLAEIFPSDLLAPRDPLGDPDSRGLKQRDKLYGALKALATMYDPDNPDSLEPLDTALQAMGRAHAAFWRPSEGVTRGATLEEYAAVKAVLFGTLHDLAGEAWLPEYDAAWSEAYDYAAAEMLREQHHSGFKSARYPRQAR